MGVEQQLNDIIELLKKINESLEKLEKTPQYNMHIEQADFHNPALENLEFNLETVDVEDLSGSLNLGNNFGIEAKGIDSSKKAKEKKKKMQKKVKKLLGDIKKSGDRGTADTSVSIETTGSDDMEE